VAIKGKKELDIAKLGLRKAKQMRCRPGCADQRSRRPTRKPRRRKARRRRSPRAELDSERAAGARRLLQ